MRNAWRTLAGVTLALAGAHTHARAQSDGAARVLESVEQNEEAVPALAAARIDWRTVVAVGWTLEAWSTAVALFGDLVELLPEPSTRECWRADDDDWLLRLRCAYWDWKDTQDEDQDEDQEEDADDRSDERSRPDTDEDEDDDDPWGGGGDWDRPDEARPPSGERTPPSDAPGLGG